jgi:hypothetical protein
MRAAIGLREKSRDTIELMEPRDRRKMKKDRAALAGHPVRKDQITP